MMKKGLLGVIVLLVANLASASLVVTLPAHGLTDPCQNIVGAWSGSGVVTAEIIGMPINCTYHGEGQVPSISSSGEISMNIQLTKESGFCPDGDEFTLRGTCRDGRLSLDVTNASLQGTLSADGRSADMSGTVGVDVLGQYIIANVESMHLTKK